jgi:uracil DNA glycosylase
MNEFNTDAFLYFKNELLPQEKYYPEADEVFRVFSMPVYSIRVVIVGRFKQLDLAPKDIEGVFRLPISLTQGADTDHTEHWEPFIKKVIYFIAKTNSCIWVLPTTEAQRFTANLPSKSIFNVLRYTDDSIQGIPTSVDYNYIFKGKYVNLDHINVILKKLRKKIINW